MAATEPLDLDALERSLTGPGITTIPVADLIAELRATRAERDAAIQSGWFQADRAERAEAAIARVEDELADPEFGCDGRDFAVADIRAALRGDQ